jgi:hypothetical protein
MSNQGKLSTNKEVGWNNPAGLAGGQSLGKKVLHKTEDLQRDLNTPLVHVRSGAFPVTAAPWNESEANTKEKVGIYQDFLKSHDFKDLASQGVTVPFNINEGEIKAIYEEKRDATSKLNYYSFLEDLMAKYAYSPSIVKYVRDMCPQYFEERLALIDRNLDLQRMAARLLLKQVPDTPEELQFMYALSTGQIELPKNVAWDNTPKEADSVALQRGFLSIKKRPMPDKTAMGNMFVAGSLGGYPGIIANTSATGWQTNPGNRNMGGWTGKLPGLL